MIGPFYSLEAVCEIPENELWFESKFNALISNEKDASRKQFGFIHRQSKSFQIETNRMLLGITSSSIILVGNYKSLESGNTTISLNVKPKKGVVVSFLLLFGLKLIQNPPMAFALSAALYLMLVYLPMLLFSKNIRKNFLDQFGDKLNVRYSQF